MTRQEFKVYITSKEYKEIQNGVFEKSFSDVMSLMYKINKDIVYMIYYDKQSKKKTKRMKARLSKIIVLPDGTLSGFNSLKI